MSLDPDKQFAGEAVKDTLKMLAEAAAEEEQLELIEPVSADDIEQAREGLGPGAGLVTVLREARAIRNNGGRKPGVRNRRTGDFIKYISAFGQDPAITLMQIQATPTEELVARSRLVDPAKRQLTYAEAAALRVRCAEALLPYVHSKQPVAVDAQIRGVMVIEEIGGAGRPLHAVLDIDDTQIALFDGEDAG